MLSGRGAVEFWSGDFDRAASLLHKAAALFDAEDTGAPCSSYEAASCRGYLALLHALRGQLNQAADLAAAATVVPPDSRAAQPCAPAAVALAHVHLERNELTKAHGLLKLADASLHAYPDKLVSAVGCLVVARARLADGHHSAAPDMLARARSGWSPPPWLDHLLTVTESRVCAVVGDTRAAMDAARRAGTVPIPQPPDCQPPPVIEPLTERERDVLRLAGELLSTDEIADKLFISTNTVKTHLKNSFRKLGVTDRRDAVRRARETGSL